MEARCSHGGPLNRKGFYPPCFFSDRDLRFILHLNDRKSRWNVRAQTMVSAVGGLALAARAGFRGAEVGKPRFTGFTIISTAN